MRWLVLLIFLVGCTVNIGCDKECKRTGCSGVICSDKDIFSTCEYKEEYDCYKLINCKCINGKCAWEENKEFRECMDKFK